eukprot:3652998-Amphidinium_carterae.1
MEMLGVVVGAEQKRRKQVNKNTEKTNQKRLLTDHSMASNCTDSKEYGDERFEKVVANGTDGW